ncbi:hypothetical protein [Leptolyngbya sp. FACHB-17]|uniref:hypothetical protein n=1 Tax=unclassified Leptolyngbya TaxID=2650499 RepID=UPI001680011A|nr:hypothetical protein [Leptolyngbya sp. FACHB-17]MBD2081054.1 hypothetical protein [Leptolyngbya sp. FACHB-17]
MNQVQTLVVEYLRVALECLKLTLECLKLTLECLKLTLECLRLALECLRLVVEYLRLALEYLKLVVECLRLALDCWIVKRRVGRRSRRNLSSLEGMDEKSDRFEQEMVHCLGWLIKPPLNTNCLHNQFDSQSKNHLQGK